MGGAWFVCSLRAYNKLIETLIVGVYYIVPARTDFTIDIELLRDLRDLIAPPLLFPISYFPNPTVVVDAFEMFAHKTSISVVCTVITPLASLSGNSQMPVLGHGWRVWFSGVLLGHQTIVLGENHTCTSLVVGVSKVPPPISNLRILCSCRPATPVTPHQVAPRKGGSTGQGKRKADTASNWMGRQVFTWHTVAKLTFQNLWRDRGGL